MIQPKFLARFSTRRPLGPGRRKKHRNLKNISEVSKFNDREVVKIVPLSQHRACVGSGLQD